MKKIYGATMLHLMAIIIMVLCIGYALPVEAYYSPDYMDTTTPVLTISTLSDGSWSNNETLNISGMATDNMGIPALTINGDPVTIGLDSTFSEALTLMVGPNIINAIAADAVGLQATDTRTITFDPPAMRIITRPW